MNSKQLCILCTIFILLGSLSIYATDESALPEYPFTRVGYLPIANPESYTFAVSGTTPCALTIGGESIAFDETNRLAVFHFETPGFYPIRFGHLDATTMLYAATGVHEAFDPELFQQVGDTEADGLSLYAPCRTLDEGEDYCCDEFSINDHLKITGLIPVADIVAILQGYTDGTIRLTAEAAKAAPEKESGEKAALTGKLVVTEMMYNPPSGGAEFLELRNISGETIDLSGAVFTNGIIYTFPASTTLAANAYFVLVNDTTAFTSTYTGIVYHGVYTGGLAGAGETVELRDATSEVIFSFTYDDESPWPAVADGLGYSLVNTNPSGDMNDFNNWRASAVLHGEPGEDNTPMPDEPAVLINEVLTHTDTPLVDSVEFFNPTGGTADIRGWFITDDRGLPQKARIPDRPEFNMAPGAYAVIYQNDFETTPGTIGTTPLPGFALSSAGDEEIYLYSADAAGSLTGYSHGYELDGAENGVSFGRFSTSDGVEHFFPQTQLTLGGLNSGPAIADIVIAEIHYQPLVGEVEYIALTSRRAIDIELWDNTPGGTPANTWHINGIGYGFPPKATIPAFGTILVVNNTPDLFRTQYNVPAGVAVYGPFGNLSLDGMASLNNTGETLTLLWPDKPTQSGDVGYIPMDKVRYRTTGAWPDATGNGNAIHRSDPTVFGGEPTNWSAAAPTYPADNPGAPTEPLHSADYNHDLYISEGELQRVIEIYSAGGYQCTDTDTEDGFLATPGTAHTCTPHSADTTPQDWQINLSELIRVVQIHNAGPYVTCSEGEDGVCLE